MVQRLIHTTAEAKLAWTIAYRALLILTSLIGAAGIAGFWLFSDRHNDDRYVRAQEYIADKVRDRERRDIEKSSEKELRSQGQAALDRRLDTIDTTLKEIANDVKQVKKL